MKKKRNKIEIRCAYKEIIPISQLKPNPQNPNIHPAEQIEKLSKIIQAHGWRHPITVSNLSGFIVSGHCRFYAAQKLGLKSVPVDFQDFESKAEELGILLADNKIQELSEIDSQKMSAIIGELELSNYDLELTAIDPSDFEPADVKDIEYKEEEIRPYQRTHILLSFAPEMLMQIQPHLEKILSLGEIEIEQASN